MAANNQPESDQSEPVQLDVGQRTAELAANLTVVRHRIETAAASANRDPGEITLVAVTKTWPASDVRLLAGLGVTDIGENRDQEASAKQQSLVDVPLRWHFIGRLQRNKVRSVVSYSDVVQSVDRAALIAELDRAGQRAMEQKPQRLQVFLQVDLGQPWDPARGGADPAQLPELADEVAAASTLELMGLMVVAPLDADPAEAFATLATLSERLRTGHPGAVAMSAGMSQDLEQAIAAGATHVRVGSDLLGHRPPLR
jgi:pyridoxal phosphate enzyme (YggS family)